MTQTSVRAKNTGLPMSPKSKAKTVNIVFSLVQEKSIWFKSKHSNTYNLRILSSNQILSHPKAEIIFCFQDSVLLWLMVRCYHVTHFTQST